jgi:thiamine-phosphate pyrophosphorylase
MKGAPRDSVLETALRVREITRGSGTLFIVNDDVTIARDVDADGVHLGQRDLPIDEARRLWPAPGKRFGLSTHNEREALIASRLSPDYIGVGPVFATPTKAIPDPVLGPERMGTIIRSVPVSAVALGGIDGGNLAEVLRHGARNFCVVRAVTRRPDPETAIRELQGIWRQERVAG